jgi:hypothetical protein
LLVKDNHRKQKEQQTRLLYSVVTNVLTGNRAGTANHSLSYYSAKQQVQFGKPKVCHKQKVTKTYIPSENNWEFEVKVGFGVQDDPF